MDFEQNVISILTDVLGEPKRSYTSSGGWIEYNCPCCADELGHQDGKYNLAVTLEGLYGHCWKCGYSGKLSTIIRKYGSADDLGEYKNELSMYKESRLFSLTGGLSDSVDELDQVEEITLPEGFRLIEKDYIDKDTGKFFHKNDAIQYLEKRGVDEFLVKKFNIGFCSYGSSIYSHRIVIPSYDMYGELNYWVARDYTGKNKWKILNPKVDKKAIVFNEYFINWYEPITLVEGPFDHIVVPNSIPLLGSAFDDESMAYKTIMSRVHAPVNIMLDNDAVNKAYRMYKFLNSAMPGNVRIVECPDGYDPSDYHRDFGRKGIVSLLRTAHCLDDFTLATI